MKRVTTYRNILILAGALFALSGCSPVGQDQWVEKFKSAAPKKMCEKFLSSDKIKPFLEKRNIDQTRCETLTAGYVDKCLAKFKEDLPKEMDASSGGKWGQKLGACAGALFYDNNLKDSGLKMGDDKVAADGDKADQAADDSKKPADEKPAES